MRSLVEELSERKVGTVESVSAGAITVLLEPDAPQATAFNTGSPTSFPRINGYLLVPNEAGATVGLITSVRVERLPFPKRKGMRDFGLVDLPFPARLVTLTPLGTLRARSGGIGADPAFNVHRGIDVFPSVGDSVALATRAQLRAIVEGDTEEARRVLLGTCPVAFGAPVYFDPDRLFGRHLAVLGNTGAGKSCTVAGLVRWSLEAATKNLQDGLRDLLGEVPKPDATGITLPNARFIILDPNGEYEHAFKDLSPRVFRVAGGVGAQPLRVPAWLWNGEEWAAFTNAAPGVQRPLLFEAIRRLRSGTRGPDPAITKLHSRVKRYQMALRVRVQDGDHLAKGKREGVADLLLNLVADFTELTHGAEPRVQRAVRALVKRAASTEDGRRGQRNGNKYWHNDFSEGELAAVARGLDRVARRCGAADESDIVGEDAPHYFRVEDVPGLIDALAADAPGRDVSQFVDSLNLRIRGLLSSGTLAAVACPEEGQETLATWLETHIGASNAAKGMITILDLSLVPSEAVHVIVAVVARLTFEALQRHRRRGSTEAPTVLVLDEAHTFVHRELTDDGISAAGRACCRTFERIAREGRKFGLGLLLASQRPSEVSSTVLSQCNTFLLHRLVNDRDQELVKRLVPDGLGDLLRELPSLPTRRAIMLGWAAPSPVLVEVRELTEGLRPHSPDPAFWDVWTRAKACNLDWESVTEGWTRDRVPASTTKRGEPATNAPATPEAT